MRLDIRRFIGAMLLGGALVWSATPARAIDPREESRAMFLLGDGLEFQADALRLVAMQEEMSNQPFDPGTTQPFDPGSQQPFDAGSGLNGNPSFGGSDAIDSLIQRLQAPGTEAISGSETQTSVASDLGQLLQDSDNIQTVGAQRRSQVAFDPRVRGYHYSQVYAQAEGQYFLPVRLDLDSMLNKIDPSLIQSVAVIPGPYGVRYGPGFAFIDIDLIDTPRYCDCPQQHGRAAIDAKSNGGQLGEWITAMGGGNDYGYIVHYGQRKGSDYLAGNGQQVPSSYQSQNVLMQFGFDWSPNTKTEIRYNYFGLGDTEYALQFFDVSSLKTNALNVITTNVDPTDGSVWINQIWFNETDFRGNNGGAGKRGVRGRITDALNTDLANGGFPGAGFGPDDFSAAVDGDLGSHGARSMKTWGDDTSELLRVGTDFRFIAQSTQERFNFTDQPGDFLDPDQENFSTNQPRSVLTDPGAFVEIAAPWTDYLRVSAGARLDWAHTYRATNLPLQNQGVLGDFSNAQNDLLGAAYLAGDVDLASNWHMRLGAGYAEKAPNLVDRYSDGIFISMIQSGFSRVIGRPSLDKEQAMQIDASLRGDFDYGHVRMSAYHSWIHDYNTYFTFGVDPPTGARFLAATNTPLATLKGFELYGDYQASEQLTFFATMNYVEGTDQTISQPLPGMYPLESRLGLRVVDGNGGNTWGWEWGWRLVDAQNRIGVLRANDFNLPIYEAVETRTGGFATSYLKSYYNYSQNLHFIAGIDNLFDRNYVEHLDLRFSGTTPNSGPLLAAWAPGFNAYGGVEVNW